MGKKVQLPALQGRVHRDVQIAFCGSNERHQMQPSSCQIQVLVYPTPDRDPGACNVSEEPDAGQVGGYQVPVNV